MKGFKGLAQGLILVVTGAIITADAYTGYSSTGRRTTPLRAVVPPSKMTTMSHGRILSSVIRTSTVGSRMPGLHMSDVVEGQEEPAKKGGILSKMKAIVPPASERQKLVPLALMFFCILFNYTILRDTKDVLMITAPKSGAEVIVRSLLRGRVIVEFHRAILTHCCLLLLCHLTMLSLSLRRG